MQNKQTEKTFWNNARDDYAAFDAEEYLEIFKKAFGNVLDKTIIDVGCGTGLSSMLLSMGGAKVTGIDSSEKLIGKARRHQFNEAVTNFEDSQCWPPTILFKVGDAECLDVGDGVADACFYGGVLHHFLGLSKVLVEAHRILRPGGKIVAVEPNVSDVMERIEWKVADWRGKLSSNENLLSPYWVASVLWKTGFKLIDYWFIRQDIPVLNQIPILKHFFSRQRGFWLKGPLLKLFKTKGNFFVIEGVKGKEE